jgi:hypothetical protein
MSAPGSFASILPSPPSRPLSTIPGITDRDLGADLDRLGRQDKSAAYRRADCCARDASGHAATPPPIKAMNSRRFIAFPKTQDKAS